MNREQLSVASLWLSFLELQVLEPLKVRLRLGAPLAQEFNLLVCSPSKAFVLA